MELLETQIKAFLSRDAGNGSGYGYGNGSDSDSGTGYGYGPDSDSDSDSDSGTGYGYGPDSDSDSDSDSGTGYGYGSDSGTGYGYGNGNGTGYGYGSGSGYGNGTGVSEIEGHKVYKVDGVNTIITAIHGNVAQGYMIEYNTKLTPCFIVKGNNSFAHGETLHDAYAALQEKLYDNSTDEERIAAFM